MAVAGRSSASGAQRRKQRVAHFGRHRWRHCCQCFFRNAAPAALGKFFERFELRGFHSLVAEGALAGQKLPKHEAQRIDIAAPIEFVRLARVVGVVGLDLLRRHVHQRPAEIRRRRGPFQFRSEADVEIDEFRRAVGGQKHVGRLHIAMQHAATVRVIERFGQAGTQPTDGFWPREGSEFLPRARFDRRLAVFFQRPIDRFEQRFSRAFRGALFLDSLQHILQCTAGNVLHVHQLQSPLGQLSLIVDANNVRMIELRQRLWFDAAIARDFERHEPLHRNLSGEKHRAKRSFAKPHQQIEIVDLLPHVELRFARPRQQYSAGNAIRFDRHHAPQTFRLLGKAGEIIFRAGRIAGVPTNVKFFVNQVARYAAGRGKFWKFLDIFLDLFGQLVFLPAVFQVDLNQLGEHQHPIGGRHFVEKLGQPRRQIVPLPGLGQCVQLARHRVQGDGIGIGRRFPCRFKHGSNQGAGQDAGGRREQANCDGFKVAHISIRPLSRGLLARRIKSQPSFIKLASSC